MWLYRVKEMPMEPTDVFTAARKYPGTSLSDTERQIDMPRLRAGTG